jgi:porphobilinogen deaminase
MAGGQEHILRVGTRGSLLARTQTEGVVAQLRRLRPDLEVQIQIIQTTGDLRRDVSFAAVGTKGMFV